MSDRIKVWVINYGESRKNFVLQWIDPVTGKRKSESARTSRRRDAERAAIKKEEQLNSLRPNADGRTEWDDFADRFNDEHAKSLKETSAAKLMAVMKSFRNEMQPQSLRVVTTPLLSQYAAKLRAKKRTEATIAGYLGHLRVALRWAYQQGLISEVPQLPRVARNTSGRTMKGRPITATEFAKMLRAVTPTVGKAASRSWRRYLRGLWLSGLRLEESLHLTWDDPRELRLDFSGEFPVMHIPIEHDKGHRQRITPLY